jgi:hypothetical protein
VQSIGTECELDGLDNASGATGEETARHQSFCDAVLIVEATRRPVPQLRGVPAAHAPAALRRAWPMTELHPHRRQGRLPALLARHCQIFEAQLTPDPKHLLRFANAMRLGLAEGLAVRAGPTVKTAAPAGSASIVVSTAPAVRRRGPFEPTEAAAPWGVGASSVAAKVAGRPVPVPGLYRQRLMGRIRPPAARTSANEPAANKSPPWSKAG